MGCGCPWCPESSKTKIKASIMAALLFIIIASPELFGIMQSLLGGIVRVTSGGVPTAFGLVLHAVVYGLITFGLMHYKKRYDRY
jgi:hypothetical protein